MGVSSGTKEGIIIYNIYSLSLMEYFKYGILGVIIVLGFANIFYDSLLAAVFLIPVLIPYFRIIKKRLCIRQQNKLKEEFKELCISLAAQMSAGYSIENSVKESYVEMNELYGADSYICKELKVILGKLKNNISIEDSIAQLAIRSGNQDIRLFSEVLAIGKRSGGDLISIVRSAALNIAEKADAEREIRSIISEKQFEQMIMNIIPLVMISYVKLSSPEMMAVMYQTTAGRMIMSVCFAIYIAAFLLGRKIMEIEV